MEFLSGVLSGDFCEFRYFYDICYLSEDLLSVRGSDYQYTGGAHGLFHYFPVNVWIPDTRVQPLELEDLFSPNSSWRRTLASHIRRDLIGQQAQWVVDGTVKPSDLLEDPVLHLELLIRPLTASDLYSRRHLEHMSLVTKQRPVYVSK